MGDCTTFLEAGCAIGYAFRGGRGPLGNYLVSFWRLGLGHFWCEGDFIGAAYPRICEPLLEGLLLVLKHRQVDLDISGARLGISVGSAEDKSKLYTHQTIK